MTIFENDLNYSVSEVIRQKNYQIVIQNFQLKKLDAIELEYKKSPNDFDCELADGSKLHIEFKNYRHHTNSNTICLEWYSDINRKVMGWPFKLIEDNIDYVIFVWHGKKKQCYLIVKAKDLQVWWAKHHENYKKRFNDRTDSIRNGGTWTSSYSYVSIKDLPKEIIYKHEHFVDLKDFWR